MFQRLIPLALLALVVPSCGSQQKLPGDYVDAVTQTTYESSVKLLVFCPEGTYTGTGVAVSPTQVITARHVADCDAGVAPMGITARKADGTRLAMEVEELSDLADAAMLKAAEEGTRPFPIFGGFADYDPFVGQFVCIVASDGDLTAMYKKCGYIAKVLENSIVISIHGVPGNSGAAVWSNEGEVLGIVSMGRWESDGEFVILAVRPKAWQ